MTGGSNATCSFLATVEVYCLDTNEWKECAGFNRARNNHISCTLGNKIYIYNGFRDNGTIEIANCDDLIEGSGNWQLLSISNLVLKPMFAPISSHEILIMDCQSISIFDTRKSRIENVATDYSGLSCYRNQAVMSRKG